MAKFESIKNNQVQPPENIEGRRTKSGHADKSVTANPLWQSLAVGAVAVQPKQSVSPNVVMRQTASTEVEEAHETVGSEASLPHQCDDDAELDAAYEEWLNYDAAKDAAETALVNRINKEIFGPINQERNKIAADSFETTEAKKKAFPTGTLEPGASLARQKLFDALSYRWLHSDTAEDKERQQSIGVTQPVGDLSPTGKAVGRTFGAPSPVGTVWDYRGDKAKTAGSAFDSTMDSSGIEGKDNIAGYAEFKDAKGQRVFVPQLGFGIKPQVDTRQIVCHDVLVVKPGRAKRIGGSTGQQVTSSSAGDLLHGGKHFLGKGTSPTTTGKGEVLGQRAGPGKPVYWYFNQLPQDEDKREKVNELMRKKADAIMDAKSKSYENLKQFYLSRAAFIEMYQDQLK
jgi:hypothetical protein